MAAINFPTPSTVGETFTQNNKTFKWDGTSWLNISIPSTYSANVGNGSATTYTVTHNLNSQTVSVNVRENSSGYYVYPDIKYTSVNALDLEFVDAPTVDQYLVVVKG
jgi:phosphomevalonate kinase